MLLPQFIDHLRIKLIIIDVASVVNHLTIRNKDTDISTRASGILQRMTVVCRSHERSESRAILLHLSENRATIHLADRQCLLQRRLLGRTDGIELVEIHEEIVRQRHLFVELIRQIQMVEIILTQVYRQQSTHESGLSATLSPNQRRHALVAVQHIQLQPEGNGRAQPDREIVQLLGGDARDASKYLCDMVLSVPLRQVIEKLLHGIVLRHLFRLHILRNLRLRTALLQYVLALGTNHDTVESRLRQRTVIQFSLIRGDRETAEVVDSIAFGFVVSLRQDGEFYLPVEDVSAETVVFHEEQLDCKRSFLRGSWSLCRHQITILHYLLLYQMLIYSFRLSP